MKTIQLSELLNNEQIKEVEKILNGSDSSLDKGVSLAAYLGEFRTDLEAKGVLPEYLAYVLIAKHMKII